MTFDIKKLAGKTVIVTGHFGVGKTNLSVNLAAMLAEHTDTYLIDFDNVNPYFRSADSKEALSSKGVTVITPEFANTNVDIPSVSPEIYTAIMRGQSGASVIFDVGGDMLGAVSLGSLYKKLSANDPVVLYVFSAYRPLTQTPDSALAVLREIESACGLKVGFLVNNSNIGRETSADDISATEEYADKLSELSAIPVLFTSCMTENAPYTKYPVLKLSDMTKKLF